MALAPPYIGSENPSNLVAPSSRSAEDGLHRLLRRRAVGLNVYVHTRIPPPLTGFLSPEDVLQEVWIAAFRALPGLVSLSEEQLDRWLTRVANRKLATAIRRAMAQKRGGGATGLTPSVDLVSSFVKLFGDVVSQNRSPSSVASQKEVAAEVQVAIGRLSDGMRQVVWMHHVEGLDLEEIGRLLNRSPGAVRAVLFRARLRLGEILREQPGFTDS